MQNIIPQPKKVTYLKGCFKISDTLEISAPTHMSHIIERLIKGITGKKIINQITKSWTSENAVVVLSTDKCSDFHYMISCLREKEGYEIQINEQSIVIQGCDEAGLFYGIQTLIQIFEDYDKPICCSIQDWPDMEIRGVHFDLKGCMPTFEYLKNLTIELSQYKINTVLLEYEDKFKYSKHPLLSSQLALTIEQVKELTDIAAENYVTIIPLLQSLGHSEYILRHEEYAHLRESADYYQQMCPLNNKTFQLFKDLYAEVSAVHSHSKYFHIGGDETHQLGECSLCREKSQEIGKYKLYMDYIKKVCTHVIEDGKTPIIWDDMLTRHAPELFDELPKGTIIMYWNYQIKNETISYCYALNGAVASTNYLKKGYDLNNQLPLPTMITDITENLPDEKYDFFQKYSDRKNFPMEMSSTLFLKSIQDNGLQVIGASAAQAMPDTILSDMERAIPNIKVWAEAITKNKGLGMVSTSWTRNNGTDDLNGILEGMRYAFLASGEYYWSSAGVSIEAFDKKFCKRFYGFDDVAAINAIWLIRHQNLISTDRSLSDILINLSEGALKNNHNLRYYALMSKLFVILEIINTLQKECQKNFYRENYQILMKRHIASYNKKIEELKKLITQAKMEMRTVFGEYLLVEEVTDWENSFFAWIEHLLDFFKYS